MLIFIIIIIFSIFLFLSCFEEFLHVNAIIEKNETNIYKKRKKVIVPFFSKG